MQSENTHGNCPSWGLAQGNEIGHHVLDLLRCQNRLARECRIDADEPVNAIIWWHDRVGVEASCVDHAQPQLSLRPARPRSLEVGSERALELLLRVRPAMAEQA